MSEMLFLLDFLLVAAGIFRPVEQNFPFVCLLFPTNEHSNNHCRHTYIVMYKNVCAFVIVVIYHPMVRQGTQYLH